MALLASEVMDRSRAVLNDIAIDLYTNEILLPYLKIANDDLSDELTDNGATVNKEVTTDIPLSRGNKALVLPDDMIVPIELFEKDAGQDDSFYRFVKQRPFLPNGLPANELSTWTWREQSIIFVGSVLDKQVRVRYYRLITQILGETTSIELTHSLNYLSYHTAALAAEHIGQNRTKAIDLEGQAIQKLNKLLKKEVKQNQAKPTRRLPFKLNRFSIFTRR
jgi:hypothetical protein